MDVSVKGRGIEITAAMREYAQKKLAKLASFDPEIRTVEVTCKVERGGHKIEVTLTGDGVMLRAEERSSDMYEAIDLVFEKLEHQAKKHRKRLIDRARDHSLRDGHPEPVTEEAEETHDNTPRITREKRFPMKPMTPVEAAVEMELLGHVFFVFRNGIGGEVNVIYRRDDGSCGLIGPGDE